jgi:hypothetical protein
VGISIKGFSIGFHIKVSELLLLKMSKKGQKITSMTPEILAEFRRALGDDELNALLSDFDCERFLFARR